LANYDNKDRQQDANGDAHVEGNMTLDIKEHSFNHIVVSVMRYQKVNCPFRLTQ